MEEPIRILHVVAKMNRAGTETMLMNYYRHMDCSKIQFDFAVCVDEKSDYDDEIQLLGGRIIRYPKFSYKNLRHYRKWWDSFFEQHKEYKIIHGHIGSTAAIYLSIAKKHGLYTIAHSHGLKEPISIRSILYRTLSYRTRFIADQFFGCSMQALIDRYGKKVALSSRARVINNAIDAKHYAFDARVREDAIKELGLKTNVLTIGTVGRLTSNKNPHMILEILNDLKNEGFDFQFVWVGDGELKTKIEQEIQRKGLVEQVLMLGVRADVPRILQALDVFLFPSLCEGLGIVAVEAQAAGLPTLCSNAVPPEAKVTDLCVYIDLSSIRPWIEEIKKTRVIERKITTSQIIENNYDINDQAEWLQDYYYKLSSELNNAGIRGVK